MHAFCTSEAELQKKYHVSRKKIWDTGCLPAVCCYDNQKPLAASLVCL